LPDAAKATVGEGGTISVSFTEFERLGLKVNIMGGKLMVSEVIPNTCASKAGLPAPCEIIKAEGAIAGEGANELLDLFQADAQKSDAEKARPFTLTVRVPTREETKAADAKEPKLSYRQRMAKFFSL